PQGAPATWRNFEHPAAPHAAGEIDPRSATKPAAASTVFAMLRRHALALYVLSAATVLAVLLVPFRARLPEPVLPPAAAPAPPVAKATAPPPASTQAPAALVLSQEPESESQPPLMTPDPSPVPVAAKIKRPARAASAAAKPVDVAAAIAAAQARADSFLAAGDVKAKAPEEPAHAK
ncbi:MAG: hypothetical protein ACJ8GJ_24815, partial [Vitreoscilla sp.]